MRKSVALALLFVVVLSLAFVLPVYADKPVVTTYDPMLHVDLQYTDPDPALSWRWCPFDAAFVETGVVRQTEWFNGDDLVVKGIRTYEGVTAFFLNEDTGKTLMSNSISPVHYTVVYTGTGSRWTYRITGPDFVVILPGMGPVMGLIGQQTTVVDCPGQDECNGGPEAYLVSSSFHGAPYSWDMPAFCTALEGTP